MPDIALFQDFRIEQFIHDYPDAFVDLKAAGVDYSKFAAYKVGPMTVGSHVYGIPFDTGSTGLWLRTDYLRQAGFNPDRYEGKNLKWSDVVKLGVAVKAKTGKPLLAYQSDNFDMLRIVVQSTGGQFFKPDGSLEPAKRTPSGSPSSCSRSSTTRACCTAWSDGATGSTPSTATRARASSTPSGWSGP